MHIMTMIGIALFAGTTLIDRLVHKLPQWLAIVAYAAAAGLIIAGMIVNRSANT